jgi:hypothetical protein
VGLKRHSHGMRKRVHLILFLAAGVVLSGCFMHTVIGDGLGTASPDGSLTFAVSSRGASRKAYVDTTRKRVSVWVMTNVEEKPETLFSGEYIFTGADLEWSTRWHGSQEVSVEFYDFGNRVSEYDAKKAGAASNHVATLVFVIDTAGKWKEKK